MDVFVGTYEYPFPFRGPFIPPRKRHGGGVERVDEAVVVDDFFKDVGQQLGW